MLYHYSLLQTTESSAESLSRKGNLFRLSEISQTLQGGQPVSPQTTPWGLRQWCHHSPDHSSCRRGLILVLVSPRCSLPRSRHLCCPGFTLSFLRMPSSGQTSRGEPYDWLSLGHMSEPKLQRKLGKQVLASILRGGLYNLRTTPVKGRMFLVNFLFWFPLDWVSFPLPV